MVVNVVGAATGVPGTTDSSWEMLTVKMPTPSAATAARVINGPRTFIVVSLAVSQRF